MSGAVYRGLLFLGSDLMLLALRELTKMVNIPECDIPMVVPEKIGPKNSTSTRKFVSRKKVPVSEDSREFGTGTGEFPGIFLILGSNGKNWSRKKELVPVPEKFGPEKSTSTGNGKIWSQKKVPVPVSEKLVRKKYWYRKIFWVPSHSAELFNKIIQLKSTL